MANRKLLSPGVKTPSGVNKPKPKSPQFVIRGKTVDGMNIVEHLNSNGNMTPKQIAQKVFMQTVKNNLPPNVQAAIDIHNMLPPKYRVSTDTITKAFKKLPATNDNSSIPMGGDNVMNSSYGLSKAPKPKMVNLNSGILPNTYSKDYMLPIEGLCSPLHISNQYFTLGPSGGDLNNYFKNTICFDIQTRAQANVGFNVDITSILSATKLTTAFEKLIRSLQVYYYYSSILSYESDSRNKNPGMIALRANITPTILSSLAQLGRRLEDTPCPPRVLEWVRYMSMNYLSGNSQGAALIKFGIEYNAQTTTTDHAAVALSELSTSDNLAAFSLIRRCIPQWVIGTLYDVPPQPVFDKNFLTIFANTPLSYTSTTASTYLYPTVTDASTIISYNSFNNKLDGAAFALQSVRFSSAWYPGVLQPTHLGNGTSSRLSYYTVGGTTGWYSTSTYPFLGYSRLESYTISAENSAALTPHLYGADKCQNVSGSNLLQTATNFLDFLFNVNSIPSRGRLTHFNGKGSNRI